jgi:DNA topoisomerase-1
MSDSDDVPLAKRVAARPAAAPAAAKRKVTTSAPAPTAKKAKVAAPNKMPSSAKPKQKSSKTVVEEEDDEDDDEAALKQLLKTRKGVCRPQSTLPVFPKLKCYAQAKSVWTTLSHQGVTFPPPYVPHGVKLLYESVPIDLSPEEEEVRPPASSFFSVLMSLPCCFRPQRFSPR